MGDTLILDGSNPKAEKAFVQEKVGTTEFKDDLKQLSEKQEKRKAIIEDVAKIGGGLAVGIGAAFISLSAIHPNGPKGSENGAVEVPDDPQHATSVNDGMSFDQAFATARAEVGQGGYFNWHGNSFNTYYKEEWDQLSPEEQQEFTANVMGADYGTDGGGSSSAIAHSPIIIHDEAPVAEGVTDDMSFADAFGVARSEVGPGGVFEWRGNLYNTYTPDEFNRMTDEQQQQYAQSLNAADFDESSIQVVNVDNPTHQPADVKDEMPLDGEETFMGHDEASGADIYMVDGEMVYRLDRDGDGTYEIEVSAETGDITDLNTGEHIGNYNDIPNETDAVYPVETQDVVIDGMDATATVYSDGHIEANIDVDGDGTPDNLVIVNEDGTMQIHDMNGNVMYNGTLDDLDDPSGPGFSVDDPSALKDEDIDSISNDDNDDVIELDDDDYDIGMSDYDSDDDFSNNSNVDDWV
jgi:succinate dehydrogenase flavin-adding protein (antitoxin of CptAB toxin-antitoxin module)